MSRSLQLLSEVDCQIVCNRRHVMCHRKSCYKCHFIYSMYLYLFMSLLFFPLQHNIKWVTISNHFLIGVCHTDRSSHIRSIVMPHHSFSLSLPLHSFSPSSPLAPVDNSEMWSAKDNTVHRERTTNHSVFINPPPRFCLSSHLVIGLSSGFERTKSTLNSPALRMNHTFLGVSAEDLTHNFVTLLHYLHRTFWTLSYQQCTDFNLIFCMSIRMVLKYLRVLISCHYIWRLGL